MASLEPHSSFSIPSSLATIPSVYVSVKQRLYTVGIVLAAPLRYYCNVTGKTLKNRRRALGFTQAQLAEALGVMANTVARWERGERRIPSIMPLALETVESRVARGGVKKKSVKDRDERKARGDRKGRRGLG
jgi:DNA-binding transcriptional regulator YiaG